MMSGVHRRRVLEGSAAQTEQATEVFLAGLSAASTSGTTPQEQQGLCSRLWAARATLLSQVTLLAVSLVFGNFWRAGMEAQSANLPKSSSLPIDRLSFVSGKFALLICWVLLVLGPAKALWLDFQARRARRDAQLLRALPRETRNPEKNAMRAGRRSSWTWILPSRAAASLSSRCFGATLVLGSLVIGAIAHGQLGPFASTFHLAGRRLQTDGLFAWCRHPMYLSYNLQGLAAVGLTRSLLSIVALAVLLLTNHALGAGEDVVLAAGFGASFDVYAESVWSCV